MTSPNPDLERIAGALAECRADVRPGLRVAIRCLEKAAQRHDDAGDASYATVIDKATSELYERLDAIDAMLGETQS